MANYWEEKRKRELAQGWLVLASDMDGLTGYQVVHALDAPSVRKGYYGAGCVNHLTLNKAEAIARAEQLNKDGVEPPENNFRGLGV